MPSCGVSMMGRRLVPAIFVVLGRFLVMPSGMGVMLRGFPMMFSRFLRHAVLLRFACWSVIQRPHDRVMSVATDPHLEGDRWTHVRNGPSVVRDPRVIVRPPLRFAWHPPSRQRDLRAAPGSRRPCRQAACRRTGGSNSQFDRAAIIQQPCWHSPAPIRRPSGHVIALSPRRRQTQSNGRYCRTAKRR